MVSNQPSLSDTRSGQFEWVLLHVLFYSLLLFVVGPITLGLAFYFPKLKFSRPIYPAIVIFSLSWLFVVPPFMTSLGYLWILSIPLVPLCSILYRGFTRMAIFTKPRTLQEQLAEEEQRAQAQNRKLSKRAEKTSWAQTLPGKLRLGVKLKGDVFPDDWLHVEEGNEWIGIDESVLDQHVFLLGSTGAGKSETIKRLAYEIFAATERDVYFVDGKGDGELANDIRTLAHHFGRGEAPVFKLGFDTFGAIYDGFRGHHTDIYNRLLALIGVHEAEGNAQFYADINRTILQFVCKAPSGPPRDFGTVLARINKDWLLSAYKGDKRREGIISNIEAKHFESMLFRLIPLVEDFDECVGEDGFALEDRSCAIFSMRVQSVSDTAKHFLDFLVEDLKDFIGKRQKQPAVLVIDEFGQFSNKNITALLSLARSSQLGVILATQDTATLKDEQTKKNVLANTRTKLLMATDFPQEIGELAGTYYQVESSFQHSDGDITGVGSARIQHAFKIDMNEAAQLRPGEAFLIRQRYTAKIKVKAIGKLNHIPEQTEEKRTVNRAAEAEIKPSGRRPPELLKRKPKGE